jgi:hypothetical protein
MFGPSRVLDDLRHAIRLLRNSPGFSALAIATIALAIGPNTAMFSFVNGVLLRPLPYPESDRIVRVLEKLPTGELALIGLSIGLIATIPTTDVLSSMLYGVATYDPLTIAVAAAMLSGVAGLACFLPAWRITSANPMEALRYQ